MENIKSFENYADQCPKGGKYKWCRGVKNIRIR